jgi:hypothetical protein
VGWWFRLVVYWKSTEVDSAASIDLIPLRGYVGCLICRKNNRLEPHVPPTLTRMPEIQTGIVILEPMGARRWRVAVTMTA